MARFESQTSFPQSINRRVGLKTMCLASLAWIYGSEKCEANRISDRAFELQIPAMGSLLNIRWILEDLKLNEPAQQSLNEAIGEEARSVCNHWTSVLSDYDEESEAMQLASLGDTGRYCWPSEDFAYALDVGDRWYRLSEGALDIALGAMTSLRRKRTPPDSSMWLLAKQSSGWGNIEWDPCRRGFRFSRPGIRFDFGAIGKGLVADKVYAMMFSKGVGCCIVNFSGNMRIGSAPPGTTGWPVAIDNLYANHHEEESLLRRDRYHDCGIATSGSRWQRFLDSSSLGQEDKTSHILDPRTLNGIKLKQSATIVSATAIESDAAATATSVHQTRDIGYWLTKISYWNPSCRWIVQSYVDDDLLVRTNY
ncbi:MAG: FAD:protein FMN transferase [Pirellula sp.]|jgi:thiamine biosynthesis lipoprotein|nr:FAD:protein FMN transferase [Pirellula sp.]